MIEKEKTSHITQPSQFQLNDQKQKLLGQKEKFVALPCIQLNNTQNDDNLIEIKLKKLIIISDVGKKIRKNIKTESQKVEKINILVFILFSLFSKSSIQTSTYPFHSLFLYPRSQETYTFF